MKLQARRLIQIPVSTLYIQKSWAHSSAPIMSKNIYDHGLFFTRTPTAVRYEIRRSLIQIRPSLPQRYERMGCQYSMVIMRSVIVTSDFISAVHCNRKLSRVSNIKKHAFWMEKWKFGLYRGRRPVASRVPSELRSLVVKIDRRIGKNLGQI